MQRLFGVLALAVGVLACGRDARTSASPDSTASKAPAAGPSDVRLGFDPGEARKVMAGLRVLAEQGEVAAMMPFVLPESRNLLSQMKSDELKRLFSGEPTAAEVNGGRVLLWLQGGAVEYAAFFWTEAGFKYDPEVSLHFSEPDPGPRVPENRDVPVALVMDGIPGKGRLIASIETTKGTLECVLFEDLAPITTTNFVALARGLRAFRDYQSGKWVRRPFYDGIGFHRVIPGLMVQAGCPRGDGQGDPGYAFRDEFHLSLRHDRPGRLSMANHGPNTNGSQFLVTEVAAPWLDDHHTIFGQCGPLDVIKAIARVPATDGRPNTPVVINRVTFRREER